MRACIDGGVDAVGVLCGVSYVAEDAVEPSDAIHILSTILMSSVGVGVVS